MRKCLILGGIGVLIMIPLLLMIGNSFMGEAELRESYGAVLEKQSGKISLRLLPQYPTLRPYVELLLDTPDFFVMFWNSCKQVFPILIGQAAIGVPAAWAFARYEFRGRKILFYIYMILMILPFQVTMVSNYLLLSKLALMDTHFALILLGIFSTFPVFLMEKFFRAVPEVMIDAARVDGASEWQIFFKIGLPLGNSGILASFVLNFLEYWNAIEAPQKVEHILFHVGSEVKKGETILSLNLEYLQEQITEQQREIEKIQITLRQQELQGKSEARLPATAQAKITLQEAENHLQTARERYASAQEAYLQESSLNQTDTIQDQTEEEKNQDIIEDIEDIQESESSKSVDSIENIEVLKEKMKTEETNVTEAQNVYRQAMQAYELAEREEEIMQENEAVREEISDLTRRSTQLELEKLQEKLNKLEKIREKEGQIVALCDGVIESIGVEEGTVTVGIEQIVLETGELEACGVLPTQQLEIVKEQDEISILVYGDTESFPVKIQRFEQDKDKNYVWYATIENMSYRTGTEFSYEYSKQSEDTYENLIPLTAVHETNNGAYVLIAKVRATVLGQGYTAVMIPVTVIGQDDGNVAVQTSLSKEELIITQSNKCTKEGDRIRIIE